MTKDEDLAAVKEIESLIEDFGSPNEQALKRFKRLVSSLGNILTGEYVTEKLGHLQSCAALGFSTRKFAKRPGGVEGVKGEARASLKEVRKAVLKLPTAE